MQCPDCGGSTVAFDVPDDLRSHAPASTTMLCAECLRTFPAAEDAAADDDADSDEPTFAAVSDGFPTGRAGVATALLCGHLDSLALHREAVEALVEAAETAGADVWLTLDRLADGRDAHFDVDRRRVQIEEFV
ncbi:MAG: DUF6276 family protein [Halolamina sp.]